MRDYDRQTSQVMVRLIDRPTAAAIDYAAHHANCLLAKPAAEPKPGPGSLSALTFGGVIVADSLTDEPVKLALSAVEMAQPMAVEPLFDALASWDYDAAAPLLEALAEIESETWGADTPLAPQKAATAWLHEGQGGPELWVAIEFEPDTKLPVDITDTDRDGCAEAAGRLKDGLLPPKLVEYLRTDYLTAPLDPEAVTRRFHELAGRWYPRLRTVMLKPQDAKVWPNATTEPEIRKVFGDAAFQQPTAVIRGEPVEGRPIYNVFLADRQEGDTNLKPAAFSEPADNVSRWKSELERWGGGDWSQWAARLQPFRDDVKRQLEARPAELSGLVGKDDWLFFRGSLDYLLANDLRDQPDDRDPYPAIVDYQQQLAAKGIDLLLVILPSKPEVYPEKLSDQAPEGGQPYVQPYTRKLLLELAEAGVEAVDLLPAMLDAKGSAAQPLYLPHDTHWTPAGAKLAASLIAARVKQYPWFPQAVPTPVAYGTKDATFTRVGDIVSMLGPKEKPKYRPMQLTARQVTLPDGTLYEDSPDSPIVMLGDSFCNVYQYEDCGHAGLSAQLALHLGTPIDLLAANGSGPKIRGQLARRGHDAVSRKKLVIWTVVARDLYHYWSPWTKIPVP